MKNFKVDKLTNGETFTTKERGNSMVPLIHSGQEHVLAPSSWDNVSVGDIVYCKVHGSYLTHRVVAVDFSRGCQIANAKGRVNGWTKNVYGKVIQIL